MRSRIITSQEEIESIITHCDVCFVSFSDTDGSPYVIPMNFGYKDNVIYLHSGPKGKSLEILERNNRVCIAFSTGHKLSFQDADVACSYGMKSKSVVAFGEVSFTEDPEKKIEALNIIMKQYAPQKTFKYSDPAVANVKVWIVEIDQMSGKELGIQR